MLGYYDIIKRFVDTGGNVNAREHEAKRFRTSFITDDVVTYVELCKATKPSTYATEIQTALTENKVCLPENIPSSMTSGFREKN